MFGATREELTRATSLANRSEESEQTQKPQSVIVNITSLCGIAPFETHGLYCMGKAAREMHHRVLAQEQLPSSKVRVLQYSPGPMDTGMQTTIRESPAVFEGLAKKYGEMKANVRALARVRITSLEQTLVGCA